MRDAVIPGVCAVLSLLLGGCATMDIATDYDPSADFSGFRSYAWMETRPRPTADPRIDSGLLESRVRGAVEAELAAKGYGKDEGGSPDFLVGYHAAVRDRLDVYTMNNSYGYRPGWGWGAADVYTYQYEEGSLVIDIVDAGSKQLVWRGRAQAEINRSAGPEERDARIRESVRRILERFPPGK